MKHMLMFSVALGTLGCAAPALAQTAAQSTTQAAPANTADDTTEVTVVGTRKSLRDALAQKKAQTGVVDVLSSKDIGAMPNVTIAETLKHLPGVNTTRDRGNDSQASIGGLGPRMVLGLLNGNEIATSEPDRNVRWEIFPSEIVSNVDLYKTSKADLISGGVSGTIDIQTIRPLDYRGPQLVVSAGPVFYDGGSRLPNYGTAGYRASGAYVTKLTPSLGLVVAATYQLQRNGYEGLSGGGWNNYASGGQGKINGQLVDTPWGAGFNATNLNMARSSLASTLQWKPSDHFQGSFDILGTQVRDDEIADTGWYTGWGNWAGTGSEYANPVIQNGALVAGTVLEQPYQGADFNQVFSQYHQIMNLFATSLNGKWRYGQWTIDATLAFSQAERYGEWQAAETEYDPGKVSFDYRGRHPSITQAVTGAQAYAAGNLLAANGESQDSHVRDALGSERLNFQRDLGGNFWDSIQFGIRGSHRDKQDAEPGATGTTVYASPITAYSTNPQSSWLHVVPAGLNFGQWTYKSMTMPYLLSGNFRDVATALYGASGASSLYQNYQKTPFASNVREDVTEAFIQGNFHTSVFGRDADGNMGVRVVGVSTASSGPLATSSATTYSTESQRYTRLLPSFNERILISDGTYIKVGVSEALSRPPLNDLRIDRSYNTVLANGPLSGSGGNPLLKPYLADMANIAYENYFRPDALFAANFFVKKLHDYIGYSTQTVVPYGVTLPSPYTTLPYTAPYNDTKAGLLSGVELTYQTPFYFIPNMDKFGIYSNLALVNSNMKENYPVGNPFPMNGVAKQTATVDLWYDDKKWDARLGFKYHSPFTLLYTWSSSGLSAIRSEFTVDFSTTYTVNDSLSVKFQASNLLNTPLRTYDNNNVGEIDRLDYYGHTYLINLIYKMK